ncbi:hypothetical protein KFE26_19715 [Shewanella sp. M16]|uniref:hypothetical protein n=1 Tax=Shewanella sp. M16 TaxID=2830837 RepID=UPI001BAF9F14|nr:hypothetical protein [Shewanella sp. M16]MBS0044509.1 hypothetical protein [Shewanella sp. M16]QYW06276.1 hypothetical protein MuM162_p35 [Shewanella phage vB_SspM_MuM16-2]
MSGQQTKAQKAKAVAANGVQSVATDTAINAPQTEQNAAVSNDEAKAKFDADGKLKAELEAQAKAEADTKAKLQVEEQAKAEAEAKAKAGEQAKLNQANQEGSNEGHVSQGNDVTNGANGNALHILGAFTVRAKTDAGFWRSGVQFHRLSETLVLVVDGDHVGQNDVSTLEHDAERVVCLTREKAQRVHSEPNLVVVDVELEDLIDPASVIK